MSRRRVLWLIKGLGLGGAERLLVSMAGRFDRDRFDVEVAYLLPRSEDFAPALEDAGVETVCLDARWAAELGWPRRLGRLLASRHYDLVHTHSPLPAAAARLLAGRAPRFVHTEHNLWSSYRRPTYVANALTFRRNAAAFAVSDAVRTSMVRPWWLGGGALPPVETLLHGVDLTTIVRGAEARARARAMLGVGPATPVVGTVASFTPQKDHAGLLAALDQVRRAVPDVRLLLVGDGPLESDLRAAVISLRLDEHVRFLGPRSDVAHLLPALDVFVLGSRWEGLPISLLEAMASGVASVATAVGGTPEAIVDEVDGRLVPPGDPSALAAAVVAVLSDPGYRARLADAGSDRVAADFSIERAVRRTEALYDRLLAP